MATSSLALRTTQTTVGTPSWELRAGSAARPHILELSFVSAVTTAAAWSIGLGRPASFAPVNQVGNSFIMDDPTEAPSQNVAYVNWVSSPTSPSFFLRRSSFISVVVGTGVIWTFPRGLPMPIGGSMVIWNITTVSQGDVSCSMDE